MSEKYNRQLSDPRWQRRRLEVFQRDDWKCRVCGDETEELHAHHLEYSGSAAWEASDDELITLCNTCHGLAHTSRDKVVTFAAYLSGRQGIEAANNRSALSQPTERSYDDDINVVLARYGHSGRFDENVMAALCLSEAFRKLRFAKIAANEPIAKKLIRKAFDGSLASFVVGELAISLDVTAQSASATIHHCGKEITTAFVSKEITTAFVSMMSPGGK